MICTMASTSPTEYCTFEMLPESIQNTDLSKVFILTTFFNQVTCQRHAIPRFKLVQYSAQLI